MASTRSRIVSLKVFRAIILLLRIKLLLFYAISRVRPNR